MWDQFGLDYVTEVQLQLLVEYFKNVNGIDEEHGYHSDFKKNPFSSVDTLREYLHHHRHTLFIACEAICTTCTMPKKHREQPISALGGACVACYSDKYRVFEVAHKIFPFPSDPIPVRKKYSDDLEDEIANYIADEDAEMEALFEQDEDGEDDDNE